MPDVSSVPSVIRTTSRQPRQPTANDRASPAMSPPSAEVEPVPGVNRYCAADLLARGIARIVPALNATAPDIVKNEPSAVSKLPTGASLHVTYHSTGIQTRPLRDSEQFKEIYGREPSRGYSQPEIGLGAIGRYERGVANTYDHLYGPPISVAKPNSTEKTYADSEFQTSELKDTKMALARAKTKAAMSANKYRNVATEAGYHVWAESRDERVIHSEQCSTSIRLDAKGNAIDGSPDLTGLFLPNIYGEENEAERNASGIMSPVSVKTPLKDTTPIHNKESYTSFPELRLITPSKTPVPSGGSSIGPVTEELRPIAALAPSSREQDPEPDSIEDYGNSKYEQDWEVGSEGRKNEPPYAATPMDFMVRQATSSGLPTPSKPTASNAPSSNKRKSRDDCDPCDKDTPRKRAKKIRPQDTVRPVTVPSGIHNKGDEQGRGRVPLRDDIALDRHITMEHKTRVEIVDVTTSSKKDAAIKSDAIPFESNKDRIRTMTNESKVARASPPVRRRSRSPDTRDCDRPIRSESVVRRDASPSGQAAFRLPEESQDSQRERRRPAHSDLRDTSIYRRNTGSERDDYKTRGDKIDSRRPSKEKPQTKRNTVPLETTSARRHYETSKSTILNHLQYGLKESCEAADRQRQQQQFETMVFTKGRELTKDQYSKKSKQSIEQHSSSSIRKRTEQAIIGPAQVEQALQKTVPGVNKRERGGDGFARAREIENQRRELAYNKIAEDQTPDTPQSSVSNKKFVTERIEEMTKERLATQMKQAPQSGQPHIAKKELERYNPGKRIAKRLAAEALKAVGASQGSSEKIQDKGLSTRGRERGDGVSRRRKW